ncbi:MAG: 2-hydroxyglutaryl-CoA dehydratase [Candidatus Tectimicrobiota bacterium]|nr:MAG: 2-hydroxyglutaryl-CoA dehydratase [Candidatus Tectomicrobia bacterium]
MSYIAGIDVGSTYTKAVILDEHRNLVAQAMVPTGFRLAQAAERAYRRALAQAELHEQEVVYLVTTGFGRHQVPFRDVQVTDLTASARGATFLFPDTRTVLDVGGQTMKASRLDQGAKVKAFRLNDKCAAGTGAFLEKTARYMGFTTEDIGPLVATSKKPVPISGVCAVFAESEVINHLSQGSAPADILHGAIVSLVDRSLQLMKRVRMEPAYTLIGGIMRFETMVRVVQAQLKGPVHVPPPELVQFVPALGAALLGLQRWQRRQQEAARQAVRLTPAS